MGKVVEIRWHGQRIYAGRNSERSRLKMGETLEAGRRGLKNAKVK